MRGYYNPNSSRGKSNTTTPKSTPSPVTSAHSPTANISTPSSCTVPQESEKPASHSSSWNDCVNPSSNSTTNTSTAGTTTPRFQTLHRLLEGIDRAYDIHRQSTPHDVLLDRLRDYDGPPYVVILDEVDQLQNKDLLYELHRIRHLSIIFIANREEDIFTSLDERLQNRLRNLSPHPLHPLL